MSDLRLANDILTIIQHSIARGSSLAPISLHEPDFSSTEAWAYVKDCLDTGWVSSSGQWVNRFESVLSSVTGADHVIAVSNGTVALRLALHLVGVTFGDEVLLPPLSFVATANAVSHLGAIPHFVDIHPLTLAMDSRALSARLEHIAVQRNGQVFNRETGRRISAVLPVHVFGHPAEVNELRTVANNWGLPLVEDAAEALGSFRGDTHCGLFGDIGILSFNGNKLITTGGGGALITNDPDLATRARHLSTTAKLPHSWDFEHDAVGWNDRLPNINAALGVAQLEDLHRRLSAKRSLAQRYIDLFADLESIELVHEPANCCSNYWLVTLRFTAEDPKTAEYQRSQLLQTAHSVGILLRPIWRPLHHLPMYKHCPAGELIEAENQSPRLINLPSSPQLFKESTV